YHPTASKDPVIQELASQGKAKVFTTDSILSLLMCATRSVYPWDIVIVKEGDKLFMDKQEGGPFDFLSVNENAADPPMESDKPDSLNTPSALSLEATFINQNFGLQVVKEDPDNDYQFDNPNPFYGPDKTEQCASAGLRYQKFDLSLNKDGDLTLWIRAEVNAMLREDSFITICTLNEFNSNSHGSGGAPNWRAKLNSQCGAVVATEMKNNSCKLAKWAVQSILAGADQIKMG
ncbi:eukaryotic translation initiation factor 3 subunit D, partial [Phakopsora pachyrhizi]